MKNSIILIGILSAFLLAINMSSCNEDRGPKAPADSRLLLDSTSQYRGQNYKVYNLEGCEYVVVGYGKERWGSHKGNCKNHIHKEDLRLDVEDAKPKEKHFDCIIEEVIGGRSHPPYAYITECGILLYADRLYRAGDTLRDYQSPKHK